MNYNIEESDDQTLVEAVLSGDSAAFEGLVRRYQNLAASIARGMVNNHSQSQDLAQEAFLRAYESLHTLKEPAKFKNWFYGVTRRTCIYWIRKQKKNLSLDELNKDGAFQPSS